MAKIQTYLSYCPIKYMNLAIPIFFKVTAYFIPHTFKIRQGPLIHIKSKPY